jgi:hypothetical protein
MIAVCKKAVSKGRLANAVNMELQPGVIGSIVIAVDINSWFKKKQLCVIVEPKHYGYNVKSINKGKEFFSYADDTVLIDPGDIVKMRLSRKWLKF